ncbi:NACHT domain-containing protein [Pannus brasiliensis CCIBt3594]|uniref:NACHT domain-containing protein n=1 Tax=Pannus brasiliensis CCIBt3594 TaxID=1427578 RepID=A0AAW9QRM4_9CHRO
MVDWLLIWGVTQAAGFAFGSLMQELAKEGAKDYGKEFFKNALGKVLRLPEKDVRKEAYGKAIKAFLELFQQQLEMADVAEDQVKNYEKSLTIFLHDPAVEPVLGSAFVVNCPAIDTVTLARSWQVLQLCSLPHGFNWEKLGKFYLRKVREIVEGSEKLRPIFTLQLEIEDNQNLREIAGIPTDYDLERYARGIQKEYGKLKLEFLDTITREEIKLWNIFVPQNVRPCRQFIPQLHEIPKDILQDLVDRGEISRSELARIEAELERERRKYFNQQPRSILEIIDSPDYLKTVFLGDPGAGKSSFLQYIALGWTEKIGSDRTLSPLPLLVELRIYARDKEEKKCQDFLEFFHRGNLFCHLNQHSLHQQLKNGQAIALFDGLDEVFDPQLRNEIITDIKRFSYDYPQVRIVVTSRWLGYSAQELEDAEFDHFMLQDLDKDQVQDFVQRWHDLAFEEREDKTRKRERLERAITESKAIRELSGNPLLLTMMAILNRTQELPRDRPNLYEKASEILLHQWDFETKDELKDPELKKYLYNIELRDKKEILRAVANGMQAGEKGLAANLIYGEDLEKIIGQYLESTGIGKRESTDLTVLIIEQLRYRNFILCSLGGNSFAFVHRTFLEYFCACEFYERFKSRGLEGGMTLEELKNEVFGQHWQDSSWHEVLRLLIGMLSAEFPKEITEELIHYLIDRDGESAKFANLFLAVDCFSEVRNRQVFAEISQSLLEHLKALWDENKISSSITGFEIYPKAVSSIARTWQDDPVGWKVLQLIAKRPGYWYGDGEEAIDQLTALAKTHPETLSILQEFAKHGAWRAIIALAQHWRDDPQTFPIIQQQARQGDWSAILFLAQHWRDDPQTFPIIQQQARQRDDPQTFPIIQQQARQGERSAIEALAEHWRDDPQTFPIIQQQARQGEESAIFVLSEHWRDDPEILPIIQQQARQGGGSAIAALAKHWRDDPQTLPIIQQQARQGERSAIEALAEHWRDDPQTFPIIQQQARQGERSAIEALAEHWRDDPQTFPIIQQQARQGKKGAIDALRRIGMKR